MKVRTSLRVSVPGKVVDHTQMTGIFETRRMHKRETSIRHVLLRNGVKVGRSFTTTIHCYLNQKFNL